VVSVGGSFTIEAYYKGEKIKCEGENSVIKITVAEFSLKKSKFSIILDKTIKMESNTQVTINNAIQFPKFTLEFYTENGEKTTYTCDDKFSLVITSGSTTVKFTEVRNNNYIDFNFDHSFEQIYKTLSGECTLTLTGGSQTLSWKLSLLGDGNEYSEEKNFDISKTYIAPTDLVAEAGKEVMVTLELRGKDGKRWKYETYDYCWKFKLEN
jgi:hypothetical protein